MASGGLRLGVAGGVASGTKGDDAGQTGYEGEAARISLLGQGDEVVLVDGDCLFLVPHVLGGYVPNTPGGNIFWTRTNDYASNGIRSFLNRGTAFC